MFRYHPVDEKKGVRPILCGFSQHGNLCVLLEYFFHLIRELIGIARTEFKSGIADDFAEAANVGGDDEASAHHLFDGGQAGGFFPGGGHDDDVEGIDRAGKFFAGEEAGDVDVAFGVGATDEIFDLRTLRAVADEEDFEILAVTAELLGGIEKNGDAFFRDETADVAKAFFVGCVCAGRGSDGPRGVTFEAVIDDDGARQRDSFNNVLRDRDVGGGAFGEEVAGNVQQNGNYGAKARHAVRFALDTFAVMAGLKVSEAEG